MIQILRAKKFIIDYKYGNKDHQIFQIIFVKDGSIFISFPYYRKKEGIVSKVSHKGESDTLELVPGGKATSYAVKYSHHWDGESHFSQDGKVKTIIRKHSVPLEKYSGHFFTVQFQGLRDFDLNLNNQLEYSNTKTRLFFQLNPNPEAIKFVGLLYSINELKQRLIKKADDAYGPILEGISEIGEKTKGFLLSSPISYKSSNLVLYLYCKEIISMGEKEDVLTFMGGFDTPNIVNDLSHITTMLMFMYPVYNINDLQKKIGSIDLKI